MLATALAFSPSAWADPIYYPFSPDVGATWKVTETRHIVSTDPAKPVSDAVIVGTLKIVDASAEGYVMEWTTKTVTAAGVTLSARNAPPEFMLGFPIRFDADQDGAPTRIHNRDDLIEKAMVGAAIGLGKTPKPGDLDKVRNIFASMDEVTLANRFLEEASLVGQCQNLEIDPDNPLKTQVQSPSIFKGPSILTNVSARVDFAGSKTKPARYVLVESYDGESAARSALDAMRKIGGDKAANDAMKDGKLPEVRHISTTTCHVDTANGETVKVISDLDMLADGKGKHDVRTITLARQ